MFNGRLDQRLCAVLSSSDVLPQIQHDKMQQEAGPPAVMSLENCSLSLIKPHHRGAKSARVEGVPSQGAAYKTPEHALPSSALVGDEKLGHKRLPPFQLSGGETPRAEKGTDTEQLQRGEQKDA